MTRLTLIIPALVALLLSGPAWAENKYGTICGNFESYGLVAYRRFAFLGTKTFNELEKKGLKKEFDDLVYIRAPNIIQAMKNLDCDMAALKENLDKIAGNAALIAVPPCKN